MAKDGNERLYTQADVDRMIAVLEAKIARLKRDSRTSSKPRSSDVIHPKLVQDWVHAQSNVGLT